ncbi:hypothetical protein TREAZ_1131 [Leadbettera azotonutricia ZAS-9]|uniref:Uncharacterized protein n=1 Tax=Leadbettera azotonutricia (strain ATCC BAA-888 / DSM 13862 / ZAS-9) TaxID=545695 RepID=F5Y764_LEAAZ|nr:hypothetical protein TREAZ_1131 [Leadbettera azotonutricia ZAS-9]
MATPIKGASVLIQPENARKQNIRMRNGGTRSEEAIRS